MKKFIFALAVTTIISHAYGVQAASIATGANGKAKPKTYSLKNDGANGSIKIPAAPKNLNAIAPASGNNTNFRLTKKSKIYNLKDGSFKYAK
jgi:hypothetical protein